MTREEIKELKGLAASMGLYDDKNPCKRAVILGKAIQALEQEPLTDKEQRVFLSAMRREEKVCREVDELYPDEEPYENTMVSVCKSIKRKVKKALWE